MPHFLDAGVEVLDFGQLDGVGEGITGGAEAYCRVGVFHGLGKDGHTAAGQAAELLAGEDDGLLTEGKAGGADRVGTTFVWLGRLDGAGRLGRILPVAGVGHG